jgi:hypothetical protein
LISSSLLVLWCGKTTSYSGKLTREHGETYLLLYLGICRSRSLSNI